MEAVIGNREGAIAEAAQVEAERQGWEALGGDETVCEGLSGEGGIIEDSGADIIIFGVAEAWEELCGAVDEESGHSWAREACFGAVGGQEIAGRRELRLKIGELQEGMEILERGMGQRGGGVMGVFEEE